MSPWVDYFFNLEENRRKVYAELKLSVIMGFDVLIQCGAMFILQIVFLNNPLHSTYGEYMFRIL
jgi:hypothetical protein